MGHTIREIDEGLDRLEAAEARLTATLDLIDRMAAALKLIAERLDKIDGKQDALDKKLDSAIPKWKQSGRRLDGTLSKDAWDALWNTQAKVNE